MTSGNHQLQWMIVSECDETWYYVCQCHDTRAFQPRRQRRYDSNKVVDTKIKRRVGVDTKWTNTDADNQDVTRRWRGEEIDRKLNDWVVRACVNLYKEIWCDTIWQQSVTRLLARRLQKFKFHDANQLGDAIKVDFGSKIKQVGEVKGLRTHCKFVHN